MPNYSIWAMEFATIQNMPDVVLVYGKAEGTRVLPFHYDVVLGEGRVILIDAGFSDNEFCSAQVSHWGADIFTPPSEILPRIGLKPEDVDTILVSHHHWDHISGINYFPNATVYMQKRDAEAWMSMICEEPKTRWLSNGLDPQTGQDLVRLGAEGRLRLVDEVTEVAPGIHIRPAHNTHTPGSQYVVVEANDGGAPWVFPGDVGYVYDNFGGPDGEGPLHPIGHAMGSTVCCIRSTREMLATAGDNVGRIVASHDARIWERFPSMQAQDGNHIAEIQLATGTQSRIGR